MDLIERIDEIRGKKGWSFYRLSQESGLSQQTFTKWIERKSEPSLTALRQVSEAFGISPANLLAEKGMVEITPEMQIILDNWHCLSKEEQESIKLIIDNYIKKKQ